MPGSKFMGGQYPALLVQPQPLYAVSGRGALQMSKIVDRTLDFIELFATERRPLSLSDISRLLKIPFSSCHDVLKALQARGYVYEIGPRAGFYPTVRLLNLAKTISDHDPILLRAEVLLRKSAAPASTNRFRSPRRARIRRPICWCWSPVIRCVSW